MTSQVAAVRAAGVEAFGVNLFVPNPVPIDPEAYEAYRAELGARGRPDTAARHEDDDAWSDKVAALLDDPVPVVSFTFGLPDTSVVRAFRRRGVVTVQSVTDPVEAVAAAERGVDVLLVQGEAAGGHSAVLDPRVPVRAVPLVELVRSVVAATPLPVVAAGGIGGAEDVGEQLAAGASAVAVGTAVLRTDEAGTSSTHRAALADAAFDRTVLTRAFTGRPARALANAFTRAHPDAPLGYPALHPPHAAAPDRRRRERRSAPPAPVGGSCLAGRVRRSGRRRPGGAARLTRARCGRRGGPDPAPVLHRRGPARVRPQRTRTVRGRTATALRSNVVRDAVLR